MSIKGSVETLKTGLAQDGSINSSKLPTTRPPAPTALKPDKVGSTAPPKLNG